MSNAHLFAVHTSEALRQSDNRIQVKDQDAWSRITQILRLQANAAIILFDSKTVLTVALDDLASSKKHVISGTVTAQRLVSPLRPAINLYIGLTKREAFEAIVYTAGQLGVSSVKPIHTQKTHRNWITAKDLTRLSNIAIAGCEQAKQFALPNIEPVQSFEAIITTTSGNPGIVCEPTGTNCVALSQKLKEQNLTELDLWIGPEGGFSAAELQHLQNLGIIPMALTPTILRSQDAVLVALGLLRAT